MVSTKQKKAGKIVQIIGSTFDVEFEEGHLPDIYNALKITGKTEGGHRHQPHRRGAAAPRRQPRAVRRARQHRRPRPRHGRGRHRRPGVRAGRPRNARPRVQPARRPDRRPRAGRRPRRRAAIHREPPKFADLSPEVRGARHRHQGHRPAHAARPRRQGRAVRRGRPRQDGHPHRTDQPHRQDLQGLLGVRRASASGPARGTTSGSKCRRPRPSAAADAKSVLESSRDGVRPDERAARRPPAGRAVGPDDGRVVPRRDRHRDAAVRR